jgi:ABC-2 type transport system permease protein
VWRRLLHYLHAINAENIKEWKIELTYRADFIRGFIEPLIYVLPYVFYGLAIVGGRHSSHLKELVGSSDMITYTVIGYVFMGFLNTACWAMGWALRKEQWFGTLESVFSTPVPRWVYVAGMATHSTVHQGFIISIQMLVIHAIFKLVIDVTGLLPSLVICALMLVALYGLGIMIAALALIFKEGWIVSEVVHTLIRIVTPIAYPVAVLPVVMQKVSMTLPTTYGLMVSRHWLMAEEIGFSVPVAFFRLTAICVVWVSFGLFIFSVIDRRVRRTGTLGHY